MPINTIIAMADIANQAKNGPWPSLEWASWIFDRASFVLIVSLILGASATVLIVWMGIVKEHHWDLARDDANKKIGELNIQAEQLRRENIVLQRELVATQHSLADRYLWPAKQPAIMQAISKFPDQTVRAFMYPASSPDTFTLGLMLAGIMQSAKWEVTLWDMHTTIPLPGISVLYREGVPNASEAATALTSALRAADIGIVAGPSIMKNDEPIMAPPAPATVAWTNTKEIPNKETIRIFIGGKENPFR